LLVVLAQFGGPDSAIVACGAALIFFLALLAKSGERSGGGSLLVYLGEISYSIYMICIPWQLLFVNLAAQMLHMDKAHLPLPVWLFYFVSVIPLAAVSNALIEKPARALIKSGLPRLLRPAASVA
jgi:peptidoglycan/LPS O-acetylase OafA/YrhL